MYKYYSESETHRKVKNKKEIKKGSIFSNGSRTWYE